MSVLKNKILGVALVLCMGQAFPTLAGKGVDWPAFLARHDLVWNSAPRAFYEAPFLGNGMLGSQFYQLDDQTIRISIGRSDVEDHKKSGATFIAQSRLPIGYFTLKTAGKITGFEGRMDLYNAEARARIMTDQGQVELRAIVHSEEMVIVYDCAPSGGEIAMQFDFVPLKAIAPARFQAEQDVKRLGNRAHALRKAWASAPYAYNPDPVLTEIDGYQVSRQDLVAGGETGTAWTIRKQDDGRQQLRVSIEHSYPETSATADAVSHLKAVETESLESLIQRHRVWWHAYYPKSFLSLEDTRMESFYWIQVYKFGAGARKGRAYMDVTGPWLVEHTAWANGWFNLNTQLSYWFLSSANRLEVAESLFSKMDECLPQFVANMPAKFGGKCAGMATIAPQTFVSPFPERGYGFLGDLLWTCHDYWLMLERTMDAERTTEKFFPLLKKSVNTYLHIMEEGTDGKLHLPHTNSPEYGGGEDCTFNLALFRWGCRTLIYIAERYGIDDPLLPRWKDVEARLVEYPVNENGYMVAKDFPYEKSHRHYSHLMMIYPLCEINIDQPENRALIKKSVDHWINYPGSGNSGYSWSAVAAMSALQGDGEQAAGYLDNFMRMQEINPNGGFKLHPNTMYTETSRMQPTTETPLSLCDSLQLMLLQSWGDTIRVFPAIPAVWKNVSFSDMLAKGGFEVSAVRKDGKSQFVRIKSLAGEPCLLKLDFVPERIEGIQTSAMVRRNDGTLQLDLKRGDEVILFAPGAAEDAVVEPVAASADRCNTFGLSH